MRGARATGTRGRGARVSKLEPLQRWVPARTTAVTMSVLIERTSAGPAPRTRETPGQRLGRSARRAPRVMRRTLVPERPCRQADSRAGDARRRRGCGWRRVADYRKVERWAIFTRRPVATARATIRAPPA